MSLSQLPSPKSRLVMQAFSVLFGMVALFFVWRALTNYANFQGAKTGRREEIERQQYLVGNHPTNAGAHVALAELLAEDGEWESAIHHYRTAISIVPQGPLTQGWKRKLKRALEALSAEERGEKPVGFHDYLVCEKCLAEVSKHTKHCPQCGHLLNQGFIEFASQRELQKEAWKYGIKWAFVFYLLFIVFSALPLEWKGVVIISSVIVGTYFFLKRWD